MGYVAIVEDSKTKPPLGTCRCGAVAQSPKSRQCRKCRLKQWREIQARRKARFLALGLRTDGKERIRK